MSIFDGKAWWAQPWWRKLLFWSGLAAATAGLTFWAIRRRSAVRSGIELLLDTTQPRDPEVYKVDAEKIEFARQAEIDKKTKLILEATINETIAAFKKRFGR